MHLGVFPQVLAWKENKGMCNHVRVICTGERLKIEFFENSYGNFEEWRLLFQEVPPRGAVGIEAGRLFGQAGTYGSASGVVLITCLDRSCVCLGKRGDMKVIISGFSLLTGVVVEIELRVVLKAFHFLLGSGPRLLAAADAEETF